MSKQMKSGFILSYTAIFIQSLISILYTPVMLRLLGQSNYGLLQLAISTISNLGVLSFGFSSSYMRFYSGYNAKRDLHGIAVLNGMFAMIFTAASGIAVIAGSILILNSDVIFSASLSGDELGTIKILLVIMLANLAFSFPCNVFDSYIVSQERFSFQKLLIIITSLLNPMLTLPLLLMGKGSVSVALCMTMITVIKLISSAYFCIRHLRMRFRFLFDTTVFKQLFTFSFFVFLNIISDQINWSVDKFLLGVFKGSESVAAYSIGSQFNSYFLTFSYVLSSLLTPHVHKLIASGGSKKAISKLFVRFGRVQFFVMAFIYLVFIAVGKPFMRIWSGIDSDIPFYTALILISPILITSIQSIGIEIQRAKDMHKFRSVLYILIAIGNIFMSIPLCRLYGEIGCAVGTSLSIVIGNIVIMNIYYHKRVGVDIILFWKEISGLIPAFVIPLIGAVVIRSLVAQTLISVIICTAILAVIYIVSIWFLGLKDNEKFYIRKVKGDSHQ